MANQERRSTSVLLAMAAVVLAGAAVRLWACFNDLWLDEIWSLAMARQVASTVEIFTVARHDNNHFLNTLVLYLLRSQDDPVLFRLHSVVTGIGTVILAGLIGYRRGSPEALTAVLVTGFSYPLIVYASEARGYGPAAFFGLAAFALMERHIERRTWSTAILFSLSSILGILSHLTFLHVYLALALWSGLRFLKDRRNAKEAIGELARCHAAPILALTVLYVVSVRHMTIGGGKEPGYTQADAVIDALALMVGGPQSGPLRTLCALAGAVLLASGWMTMFWRGRRDLGMFFVTATFLSPLVLTPVLRQGFLFPRYFLVSMVVGLMLIALWLGGLWRRGKPGRWACGLVLLGMFLGNGRQTAELIRHGRGGYRAALRLIGERTAGDRITLAGDHELRVGFVVAHYRNDLPRGKELLYFHATAVPAEGVEWWIAHSLDPAAEPNDQIRDSRGRLYILTATFRHAPLSGITWFIYHRQAVMAPARAPEKRPPPPPPPSPGGPSRA